MRNDMKRSRSEIEILDTTGRSIDLARCLVMLSQGITHSNSGTGMRREQYYECKTCSRRFPSFQALGGHRASHKKPRPSGQDEEAGKRLPSLGLALKPRTHECSICRLEFSTGQALGGHMRRHRVEATERTGPMPIPILKRSNSSKRIACPDLNLTPLENDLKLLFGEKAPKVDRFL